MSWVGFIAFGVAMLGLGICFAVLWSRRHMDGIVKGEIRARTDLALRDQLEQERRRTDEAALEQLRENSGEGRVEQPME